MAATGATPANLIYDPRGRLFQTSGGAPGTTQFLYDGDSLVAEYNASGTLLRRYVHGSGVDEPVLWYEGAGLGSPRGLLADHQGSVVAVSDGTGSSLSINGYDAWGVPNPGNLGRFQYTGQAWLPELGLYHYKARVYSPSLGRFLQTDPVGYDDQVNLYAYVGNDPLNHTDPTGAIIDTIVDIGFIGYSAYTLATAPSWVNAAALGADIVGAAIPGATGLGAGVRGAANGIDVARGSDRAGDTVEGFGSATPKNSNEGRNFFRGAKGNASPNFTPKPNEFKVDPATGTVKPTHGVSVFDNAGSVASKGLVPHRVDQSTIPDSLQVIQRGQDRSHFEITPKPGANLTPDQFREALECIQCRE